MPLLLPERSPGVRIWLDAVPDGSSFRTPAAHHVQGGADVGALVLDGALQVPHAPALLLQVPLTLLQIPRQGCILALHPPQVRLQPAALLPQGAHMLNACCGAGSQLTLTPAPSLQPDTATPCAAACIAAGRLRQLLIFLCLPSLLQHM